MISFGKEATNGIGIRKLFRQNCYKVYLVDEFKTSCMCSKCENNNNKIKSTTEKVKVNKSTKNKKSVGVVAST